MTPRERTHRSVSSTGNPAREARDDIIAFQLGDLFDRIPIALLAPGEHDKSRIITFEISEIARHIADGRPNIELTEIYRIVPDLFIGEIKPGDGFRIRFPWKKLIEMLRAADANKPVAGLTRAGAFQLARLLRGNRAASANRTLGRIAAGAAALSRAPQWFTRNVEGPDTSADGERILNELATSLEQFAPGESAEEASPANRLQSSEALAIATEENARLRAELDEREREVASIRKMLTDLESAAIDQIAALNQQCAEYEAERSERSTPAPPPPPAPTDHALNPQQSAMIESLTQQVAELFSQVDQARSDALQATAEHAKYREQKETAEAANSATEEYLGTVAYELERANAVLKEMEGKLQCAEKAIATKDTEINRLLDEQKSLRQGLIDTRVERDALRGSLYSKSPPEPPFGGTAA